MKLTIVSFFTSLRGTASAHFEKELVTAKMYKWPPDDFGNGLIALSPHASKGQEATVGCKGYGGWWMKFA